uniref:Transposase n=1 Tax=Timema poppense TaxID=170557 RepID=A0A7R9GV01_TIMPO|nr:unnamed protein product [Timema poppensis]
MGRGKTIDVEQRSGQFKADQFYRKQEQKTRGLKRQLSITEVCDKQKKAKTEKLVFIEDTVKMCFKADIPINKLDHPAAATQDVFLANCLFLDKATGSTVCQAINGSITQYGIEYNNILGLVSDSARYMETCFGAQNVLAGDHLLHFQCWAHQVNLYGDIFMKELKAQNQFVVKVKMVFSNAIKMKSVFVWFLQEEHADLPAILFPSPVVTRGNSWFHSVLYLNDYSDALIEFLGQYENNNASAEYLLEQQRDPVAWQSVKLQMVFVADSCKMLVELINKLEGSKFTFSHLLWHELEALMSVLNTTSVVKREELKQLLCGCAQKSAMKLAPCTTNNFFKTAGELLHAAIAALSLTPDEKSVRTQFEVLPLFSSLTSDKCVEGYLYLHKVVGATVHEVMGATVREGKVCDIIQMLMAIKVTNSAFAGPALQTIWAPVSSVDAERFFSQYDLVLTDRRTRMKEATIETCAMLSSHPPDYEKDTKIFVWNCALHSASDVVFDLCACAHMTEGGEEGGTARFCEDICRT